MAYDERFSAFMDEAEKWISKFGLFDWSINYDFSDIGEDSARTRYCAESHVAYLILNSNPPEPSDEADVRKSALHEVIELAIADYSTVYRRHFETSSDRTDAIDQARHALVHRLQRVIEGDSFRNRVYYR